MYHTNNYFFLLLLFTLLLLLFFALLPYVNRYTVKHTLRKKINDFVLSPAERNLIFNRIIHGSAYSSLITKSGFLRFGILSMCNLTFAALFFGIEDSVRAINVPNSVNIAEPISMLVLSILFYFLWLFLKEKYRGFYNSTHYCPVLNDAKNTEKPNLRTKNETFSHLCEIALMSCISSDGLGDVAIKESIENAIQLSHVYHNKRDSK